MEKTALLYTAGKGHPAVDWLLLTHKVNVDIGDRKWDRTSLIYVAQNGHTTVMDLPCEHVR